jgi:hypothetical protein
MTTHILNQSREAGRPGLCPVEPKFLWSALWHYQTPIKAPYSMMCPETCAFMLQSPHAASVPACRFSPHMPLQSHMPLHFPPLVPACRFSPRMPPYFPPAASVPACRFSPRMPLQSPHPPAPSIFSQYGLTSVHLLHLVAFLPHLSALSGRIIPFNLPCRPIHIHFDREA